MGIRCSLFLIQMSKNFKNVFSQNLDSKQRQTKTFHDKVKLQNCPYIVSQKLVKLKSQEIEIKIEKKGRPRHDERRFICCIGRIFHFYFSDENLISIKFREKLLPPRSILSVSIPKSKYSP